MEGLDFSPLEILMGTLFLSFITFCIGVAIGMHKRK